jgi:hypothetical protein
MRDFLLLVVLAALFGVKCTCRPAAASDCNPARKEPPSGKDPSPPKDAKPPGGYNPKV